MTKTVVDDYATAGASELRGDPMLGTAFPAGRLLLIEQPGPWGRGGLRDSRFDRTTALAVEKRSSWTRCPRLSGGSCTSTYVSSAASRRTARATSPSVGWWSRRPATDAEERFT